MMIQRHASVCMKAEGVPQRETVCGNQGDPRRGERERRVEIRERVEFNSEFGESSGAVYLSICVELKRVMER